LNNRGRTVFETLLALIIIGILLVGAITYVQKATRVIKEYAMISELSNIRTSILMYFVINRKFPESLKQMVEEKIILPFWDKEALKEVAGIGKEISLQSGSIVIDRTYLEKMSIDSDGNILDPFGKPYLYDQKLKRVKSSTAGYEAF
jgi:type II secretory pathway pseudopilin PulG